MADFARLGEAVAICLGREPGTFLMEYSQRRLNNAQRTLEGSPVASACLTLLRKQPDGFTGTVGGLFELLTRAYRIGGEIAWPKSPRGFSDALRRVAPAFRQIGIEVDISSKRTAQGYTCELRWPDQPSDNE